MNSLRNRKVLVSPMCIYICIMMLVYILPSLKVTIPYYAAGGMMLLMLPLLWIKCNYRKIRNAIVFIVVGSIFVGLIGYVSGAYSLIEGVNESIRSMRFFVPSIVGTYLIKITTEKQQKNVLLFFILLSSFVFYRTSVALATNQWITRVLARSVVTDTPEMRFVRMQNVGGFEFSYMIGIIVICVVWIILHTKRVKSRIISVFILILSYRFIIKTMYTTLLLITTVCVLLILLKRIDNKKVRILCIIAIMCLIGLLPRMFGYLSSLFDNSLLSTKFLQIQSALTGGGLDSLGSRPEKIIVGIEAWLRNPLFGGNTENVNSHSMVVGILVATGIFGIVTQVFLFYTSYNLIKDELIVEGYDTSLFRVSSLYVVVLAFLNPIGYVFEVMIAAFIISPICTMLFSNRQIHHEV